MKRKRQDPYQIALAKAQEEVAEDNHVIRICMDCIKAMSAHLTQDVVGGLDDKYQRLIALAQNHEEYD